LTKDGTQEAGAGSPFAAGATHLHQVATKEDAEAAPQH